MHSQRRNLPPFEPLTSKPSKVLNYSFGLLISISLVLVTAKLFVLLFFISLECDVLFICLFLIIPTIALQVIYFKRTMKHTTMIIDKQGIRYINKFNNKVENTIPWESFENIDGFKDDLKKTNPLFDSDLLDYDVFAKMINSGKYSHELFVWFVKKDEKLEVHKEKFSGNHIFSMFYTNRLELVRGVLLGLAHFRPDLKIHYNAFSMYYINPESFTVEYGKRKEDLNSALYIVLIVIIIAIFILLFAFL